MAVFVGESFRHNTVSRSRKKVTASQQNGITKNSCGSFKRYFTRSNCQTSQFNQNCIKLKRGGWNGMFTAVIYREDAIENKTRYVLLGMVLTTRRRTKYRFLLRLWTLNFYETLLLFVASLTRRFVSAKKLFRDL